LIVVFLAEVTLLLSNLRFGSSKDVCNVANQWGDLQCILLFYFSLSAELTLLKITIMYFLLRCRMYGNNTTPMIFVKANCTIQVPRTISSKLLFWRDSCSVISLFFPLESVLLCKHALDRKFYELLSLLDDFSILGSDHYGINQKLLRKVDIIFWYVCSISVVLRPVQYGIIWNFPLDRNIKELSLAFFIRIRGKTMNNYKLFSDHKRTGAYHIVNFF